MKKMFFIFGLVVFLFGFVGCEKSPVSTEESSKTWKWGSNDAATTVILKFYPAENRFHSTVLNPTGARILFENDVWFYYKIKDGMMGVNIREIPSKIDQQSAWIIHQHTENILDLENVAVGHDISIKRYLFRAQN